MNTKLGLEQKSIVTEQRAESPTPKGWMWCCDGRGRYLECSPEVSECLGISAKDFMGMPVAWFGLTLSSAERLQEALLKASFPTRLELIYQTHEGIEIPEVEIGVIPSILVIGVTSFLSISWARHPYMVRMFYAVLSKLKTSQNTRG